LWRCTRGLQHRRAWRLPAINALPRFAQQRRLLSPGSPYGYVQARNLCCG